MKKFRFTLFLVILTALLCSCNSFKDSEEYTAAEHEKHLEGTWTISKASRNGVDITKLMDFSEFKVNFKTDNTYQIDNYLPFLVRDNGTWKINDTKHPSQINFKEESKTEEKISNIEYLIVKGKRQLVLTFTPGYPTNRYTYVLFFTFFYNGIL